MTRVSFDGQVRVMTKIAHIYHEQQRRSEIAGILRISRADLSTARALLAAS
ncbi:MAG TPA: hypothetical protein VIT65_15045 [Microlunatus sp.]